MIESAGKAAIIQAGLNFPGMGIPSGDSCGPPKPTGRAMRSTQQQPPVTRGV